MSALYEPLEGLLFTSILFRSDLLDKRELIADFEKSWGPTLYFSHPYFPMKDYYSKEMGERKALERFFLVSKTPCSRTEILPAKIWATDYEDSFLEGKARKVNMDIGLLSLENVQLATGKNFIHRIYLGKGVFSDLNLIFQEKSFSPLSWTYPDYANSEVIEIFNWMRTFLLLSLKK